MAPAELCKLYKDLKGAQKLLEKRLVELREEIIKQGGGPGLEVQERNRTTYDEAKVHERLAEHGIDKEEYCNFIVSASALETLYLEGTLDDGDLRYIRLPRYSYALVEADEDV